MKSEKELGVDLAHLEAHQSHMRFLSACGSGVDDAAPVAADRK